MLGVQRVRCFVGCIVLFIYYSRLHNRLQIVIPKICLLVFLTACDFQIDCIFCSHIVHIDGASNQSEYAGENVVWSEEGRTHGEIAPVVVNLKLGE